MKEELNFIVKKKFRYVHASYLVVVDCFFIIRLQLYATNSLMSAL
jgi:hypothetical protein